MGRKSFCFFLGIALLAGGLESAAQTPKALMDAINLGSQKGAPDICPGNNLLDPGFEFHSSTPSWTEGSAFAGSVICDFTCIGKPVIEPHTGNAWAWFQSYGVDDVQFIEQEFTLTTGDFAFLRFYLKASGTSGPFELRFLVDGEELLGLDEQTTVAFAEYLPLALDFTPFLDGQPHLLRIEGVIGANTDVRFLLDDLCLTTVDLDFEGEFDPCAAVCPGTGLDQDGDGLDNNCEVCLGSQTDSADTDGDGIDDRYEYQNGLDPSNAADALLDNDGDGLTNLEEYLRRSDPNNANDPETVRFVAPNGADLPGNGTQISPWRSITYAAANAPTGGGARATLILAPGTYEETALLRPRITVRASVPNTAVVLGSIIGAQDAALNSIIVRTNGTTPLLLINNVRMDVQGVVFDGDFEGTTGVEMIGNGAGGTTIAGSTFKSLGIGLDVFGALPTLRTSKFEGWTEVALFIRDEDADDKAVESGGIGDTTNAQVGYNQFVNGNSGTTVVYERPGTLACENNYWGVEDAEAIANQIAGDGDFEPFLAASAILPASLVCTVIDAATQARVLNASISLVPSAFPPLTNNADGVYVFSVVPEGAYVLTANAAPRAPVSRSVNAAAGQSTALVVVVGDPTSPDRPCGCAGDDKSTPKLADTIMLGGVLLLMLLLAAAPRGYRLSGEKAD